jgi:hypothetical protein
MRYVAIKKEGRKMKSLLSTGVVFLLRIGRQAYLLFRIWRNYMFGCVPDSWEAALSFSNYFNSIGQSPLSTPNPLPIEEAGASRPPASDAAVHAIRQAAVS